ncbi:MAG: sulfatase-like hydrolase/transferase [Candidatus Aminicenantales bacterium]
MLEEGTTFTDCHYGGTVCSPSRASLLTGRNPYRLDYILSKHMYLHRAEFAIASLLKEQGYDTCFIGKWPLTKIWDEDSGQPTPGDHCFDHWMASEHNAFKGPGNPKTFIRNGKKLGEMQARYCDITVEEALQWLKNRADKTGFN